MKNIVITGSTRGIGLAMAKEFLRMGCNVQNQNEVESLWEQSAKKWGRIDIWINNAKTAWRFLKAPFDKRKLL